MLKNNFGTALKACKLGSVQFSPRAFSIVLKRPFADDSVPKTPLHQASDTQETETQTNTSTSTTEPWYLNIVKDQLQESHFPVQKLEIPQDAPDSLQTLTTYLRDNLGLTDILVFDMRRSNDSYATAVAKISDFMVMATARSGKHCHKCFVEINTLLKQKFQVQAHVEGNISANELRRRQRRLARHTNLSKSQGSRTAVTRSGVQSDSWYMMDCHLDNIFINILTETRRKELNLEELYAPPEDKHLYKRQEHISDSSVLEDDDNVLAGLKRLATRNQKRFYSTVSDKHSLLSKLTHQDFDAAYRSAPSGQSPLLTLQTATKALELMPSNSPVQVQEWLRFFDHFWCSKLAQDAEYWSLRLHFLKLLNCCEGDRLTTAEFFTNFLKFKLASGNLITKSDLLEFLNLACANIWEGPGGYDKLAQANTIIVQALQLYKGINPDIVLDTDVLCLVLKSMSSPHASLESLNGIIEFICTEFPSQIPIPVIDTVLQSLAQRREYMKALKFWEKGIKLPNANDYRPWSLFVNTIANCSDTKFIRNVMNNGNLLWIKRNNIKMDSELRKALENLFIAADPNNIAYRDLKDILLQE
ncbi:LAME_0G16930g1_1 [Lachancea meyersii CBS 8951]|uniref:ATPase synthesis protein 25 n=1 Tax=Lachancea meyersii CBS 8951 TaxID=1266667 RepID=A0A1G4KBA4_9SACH|nr:LAME_0G16930g1_1 [Lachancea meyersii CBS 8951]